MVVRPDRSIEPVWLVSQGRVLAAAARATSRTDRRRGLLGSECIDEPLLLDPCSWVHTIGMKFPIEVAYVSQDGTVLRIADLKPWRIGPIVRDAAYVIEARPGSCERWNLEPGHVIEVRRVDDQ